MEETLSNEILLNQFKPEDDKAFYQLVKSLLYFF